MASGSELTGPLRAASTDPDARPNRTFAAGRTCVARGCETRLSIYNASDACSLHEQIRPFIHRGRRGATADDLGSRYERRIA
jgi:hypothetical protein